MQVVLCLIVKNNCFGGGGRKKTCVAVVSVERFLTHSFLVFLLSGWGRAGGLQVRCSLLLGCRLKYLSGHFAQMLWILQLIDKRLRTHSSRLRIIIITWPCFNSKSPCFTKLDLWSTNQLSLPVPKLQINLYRREGFSRLPEIWTFSGVGLFIGTSITNTKHEIQ